MQAPTLLPQGWPRHTVFFAANDIPRRHNTPQQTGDVGLHDAVVPRITKIVRAGSSVDHGHNLTLLTG